MASESESLIHIDPVAINTLLQHFVSGKQGLLAQFVDGRLEVEHNGLAITVYGLTLTDHGLDIRLRFGGAPAAQAGANPETTA
ncbi:MAG: hypothetical protein HUU35_12260 [Armatimonadetes bacterium]|nr:hypothetical protein [Armatimonadota bacterium]